MAGRKPVARLGVVLALMVGLFALQSGGSFATGAAAATPAQGTLTVPSSGTVTTTFTGTIGTGSDNAGAVILQCWPGTPGADVFDLHIAGATPAFYQTHKAVLYIHLEWTPLVNENVNNLAMSYATDDGTSAGNITDSHNAFNLATNTQDLAIANPPSLASPAFNTVGVCPGNNVGNQPYTVTLTLAVAALTPPTNVSKGSQQLMGYISTIESRDGANRPNSGEPNIGSNFETGKTMYMAGNQVSQVTWNDASSPPTATWRDVTPPQEQANEDQILITDRVTGRTWAAGLLIVGSNIQSTDDDGATWNQGTFPEPHSPDHESLGSGSYPAAVTPGSYPRALYYCSQNIAQPGGAFCGVSTDGGLSYRTPSTPVFGAGTPCGAIHGHIKVSADGTFYVPQKACGVGEGFALSKDLLQTVSYVVVPQSLNPGSAASDPAIGTGSRNTLYYAYTDGSRHINVAVSTDHGKTGSWSPSVDVGAPFGIQEAEFPTAVAGDDDRAAVSFIGTTTKGDDQAAPDSCIQSEFTPATCSPNPDYFKGSWDLYVAYTYDRGATWQTVKVPGGPIQRGCVWLSGGGMPCRNMLDFNEMTVDKQGRVLVSYTDGCTLTCKTNATIDESGCGLSEQASFDSAPTCTFARRAAIARQTCGKGLFAAYDSALPACSTTTTSVTTPTPTPAITAGGGGLPDTAAATWVPLRPSAAWAVGVLPLALAPLALARRRRRRRA